MQNSQEWRPSSDSTDRNHAPSPLLIRGCALLAPHRAGRLLLNQDILIEGNRIRALGPGGTLPFDPEGGMILEGRGKVAIPGLINAHTHSPENLLKATSPSLPLELWLVPLFAGTLKWSPRLVYLSALLGAIEMLKTGTTAVLDHFWSPGGVVSEYMDAAMQAYHDAGIRASLAPSIEDRDLVLEAGAKHGLVFPSHPFVDRFSSWPSLEVQVDSLEQFFTTWHRTADGRLRCLVGPSGIHWCSPLLLESCLALAERYQTGIHLHAVETELQAKVLHDALGQGGIAFLEDCGVLGERTSLAHAIWLEPGDLERLARTGTTVVHNPVSNLRLGSGRFPLTEAQRQQVRVALGSDGSASNDTQNMFGVLKLTGLMHNTPSEDYRHWPAPLQILEAGTIGGAAALGLAGELGEIAAGQLADIVLMDLESSTFLPLRDPYLHLIYCENGESVDTVIVNGRVVVEQGAVRTVDERALRQEIREQCGFLWPGFPESLDQVANTSEVLATLATLRRLLLS
ncbi:MAG: amidohydrolase family protein [Ktedonobacteraceae bacterium]|nr:amidohydrolase family protein [Ktedonobacteraceae bacterium]